MILEVSCVSLLKYPRGKSHRTLLVFQWKVHSTKLRRRLILEPKNFTLSCPRVPFSLMHQSRWTLKIIPEWDSKSSKNLKQPLWKGNTRCLIGAFKLTLWLNGDDKEGWELLLRTDANEGERWWPSPHHVLHTIIIHTDGPCASPRGQVTTLGYISELGLGFLSQMVGMLQCFLYCPGLPWALAAFIIDTVFF